MLFLRFRSSKSLGKRIKKLKGKRGELNEILGRSQNSWEQSFFSAAIEKANGELMLLHNELVWRKKNPGFFRRLFRRRQ